MPAPQDVGCWQALVDLFPPSVDIFRSKKPKKRGLQPNEHAMPLLPVYFTLRKNIWLARLVWLMRFVIGFAFIPSGLRKVLGQRFTQISIDNPIGFFFEGLYQSGAYWQFLGYGQVAAAFLLMTQRFATLGNLIFFFIISNIWMITVALEFKGTWVITSLMLFASTGMLLWDANKLRYLFFPDNFSDNSRYEDLPAHSRIWEWAGLLLFVMSVSIFVKLM